MQYEIEAAALLEKLKNNEPGTVIDVREQEEVEMGMLPHAIHIPMNDIPNHMPEFKTDETYYIVCAHGVRSDKVADYMREHEFKAVNVIGGMAAIDELIHREA